MTDRESLVLACAEAPDDDLPRLVFADYLDEQGEGERAELVRAQCRLAKEAKWLPTECKVCGAVADEEGMVNHGRGCYRIDEDGGGSEMADENPEFCVLAARAVGLIGALGQPRPDFLHPLSDHWPHDVGGWEWRRGFAEKFCGPLKLLLDCLPMLGAEVLLVREVEVTDKKPWLVAAAPGGPHTWFSREDHWEEWQGAPMSIPPAVFRAMTGGAKCRTQPGHFRDYPTAEEATSAFHAAVLKVVKKPWEVKLGRPAV